MAHHMFGVVPFGVPLEFRFTRCLFFGAHGLDTRKQAHHLNGGEKTSLQKFESPTSLKLTFLPPENQWLVQMMKFPFWGL